MSEKRNCMPEKRFCMPKLKKKQNPKKKFACLKISFACRNYACLKEFFFMPPKNFACLKKKIASLKQILKIDTNFFLEITKSVLYINFVHKCSAFNTQKVPE
jgi:hypothetical protein